MEYYGVYYSGKSNKWAWRRANYRSDEAALNGMKTLALEQLSDKEDEKGEKKKVLVFYTLDRLTNGSRVIYNG